MTKTQNPAVVCNCGWPQIEHIKHYSSLEHIWMNDRLSQKTASRFEGWSGRDLSSRWPGPDSACCAAEGPLQVTADACRRQTRATSLARPAPLCLLCLVILGTRFSFHWVQSSCTGLSLTLRSCCLLFRRVTFRHR